jgi:hypothetical protein
MPQPLRIYRKCLLLFLFLFSLYPLFIYTEERSSDFISEGMSFYDNSDYAKALENWKRASELGNKEADFLLGFLYDGVLQNDEEAFYFFKKSALAGHVQAQLNVGLRYEIGDGVKIDYQKAKFWYIKAAYNQDHIAQFRLASLLQGVFKKYEESHFWFLKAAELSNPDAHLALATNFILGRGVDKNLIYAHMSCNLATVLYRDLTDIKQSIRLRSELKNLMSDSEIKIAEKMTRKCIDKKFKECFN